MSPFFKLPLLVLVFLFGIQSAQATHTLGADISYTCIGTNQYEVTLNVYRDCNGIALANNTVVGLSTDNCGSVSFQLNRVSTTDITPLCGTATSGCSSGAVYGVEQHTYKGIATIGTACGATQFFWQQCCRNAAVTTLNNPINQLIYVETTIETNSGLCNSSPVFAGTPAGFGCAGQVNYFNDNVYDADGDSLVFALVDCKQDPTNSVVYNAGLSGTDPMYTTGANPTTINSSTGEISFEPSSSQVAVVCVEVKEYRNGVLVGTSVRDMQFYALNCTNSIPELTGFNGATGGGSLDYAIAVCSEASLCFDIIGTDSDLANNLTLTWDNSLNGATFVQAGTNPNTATLCWSPTRADVGVHTFTVHVEDDACPLKASSTRTYTIEVLANAKETVVVTPVTDTICLGDWVQLSADTNNTDVNTDIQRIQWYPTTGLSSPNELLTNASPDVTTTYTIEIELLGGCVIRDEVTIVVGQQPIAIAYPNINLCAGADVILKASANQLGLDFKWTDLNIPATGYPLFLNNTTGTTTGNNNELPITMYSVNGSYDFEVYIQNPSTGCEVTDTVTLTIGAAPDMATCQSIYVAPLGLAVAAGTKDDPTSLEEALARTACGGAIIKLAEGTYSTDTAIQIPSFVTLEGGFIPALNWTKSSEAGKTTIHRTAANPEGAPNIKHITAIKISNAEGFRLQDLTITTADAATAGTSTYGIHMDEVSNYHITRVQVFPGDASDGIDGIDGCDGVNGQYGSPTAGRSGARGGNGYGQLGPCFATTIAGATIAGTSGMPAGTSYAGGGGGAGGSGGPILGAADNGGNGGNGHGIGGTGGFSKGRGGFLSGSGENGQNGFNGADGVDGNNGMDGHLGGRYFTGTGTIGTSGSGGGGGEGGGGANGLLGLLGSGGGGGGGGAGAGNGGTAGTGGGGSFGIYIAINQANGHVEDCYVVAGNNGDGGDGGDGGEGGDGGNGGNGASTLGGIGGDGGKGGDGGDGGEGGKGSNGFTQNVYIDAGPALVINDANFVTIQTQTKILVEDITCTQQSVQLETASGTAIPWNFDIDNGYASPNTAGATLITTTQYDSIRRYNIQAGVDVYTGFHNVALATSPKPEILTTATPIGLDTFAICQGGFAAFSSSEPGDTLFWKFNNAAPDTNLVGSLILPTVQFTTVGFYPIELSLTTSCCGHSAIDTIWLYVDPVSVATAPAVDTFCAGDYTLITLSGLLATDSIVWSPTTNLTAVATGVVSVNPLVTTTYQAVVYAQQTAGAKTRYTCPTILATEVYVKELPTFTLAPDSVSCIGNDGEITVTITNSVAGNQYDYNWGTGSVTSAAASILLNNFEVGNQCIKVTDITNPFVCSNLKCTFLPKATTTPTVFIDSVESVSCFGSTDGSITVKGTGGMPPYNYVWSHSAGLTTNKVTGLAPGDYKITITDALLCEDTITINVAEPNLLEIVLLDTILPNCANSGDGELTIEVVGGTKIYSYLWSNGQTNTTATGLNTGSTSITVTDASGCIATTSVLLTDPSLLVITLVSQDSVSCAGGNDGQATVNGVGGTVGYSYLWSNSESTATATALSSGISTVTLTDAKGCTASTTVDIKEPLGLSASIVSQDSISCAGGNDGQATVNGIGGTVGYSYLWSNSESTATATALSNGISTVTLTDAKGCTASTTVDIKEPLGLSASIVSQDSISCAGGNDGQATVNGIGGTVGYSYLWSNSESTATATALSSGISTVTLTDAKGCTASTTVDIKEPLGLSASIVSQDSISCAGGNDGQATVNGIGGTVGYSYLWSNSESTATATALSSGISTVTLTDAKGCTASTTVDIKEPLGLSASIVSQDSVSCAGGNDGQATVNGVGGTVGYSYLWSNSESTATATALSSGISTVTLTDVKGCTASTTVDIKEPLGLSASIISQDSISCTGGNDGQATVNGVGGTVGYSYLWSNSESTATATALSSGISTVTLTDAKGCTASTTVDIKEPLGLSASIISQDSISCTGGNDGQATVNGIGGTVGYSYLWSNSESTATATALSSGISTVTLTDAKGCTASTTVDIKEPLGLSAVLNFTAAVKCAGENNGQASFATSGGNAPYTYVWSNGELTDTAKFLNAAIHIVTISDNKACTITKTVTITEPTAVTATISNQTNIVCNAGLGAATAMGAGGTVLINYSYQWDATAANQTTATATGLLAGWYGVTVSDDNGCQAVDSVWITSSSAISLIDTVLSDYNGEDISCVGASDGIIAVLPSGGNGVYSYSWQDQFGNTTYANSDTLLGLSAGIYTVTVTDSSGCAATTSIDLSNPLPILLAIDSFKHISCAGGMDGVARVLATSNIAITGFLWNDLNNQTTAQATGLSAGTYQVMVWNANACTDTISITLTEPSVLSASTTVSIGISCNGVSDGVAVASGAGGTVLTNYSYQWDATASNQTTAIATGLVAGIHYITVSDDNGCTTTSSVTITEPTAVTAIISNQTNIACNAGLGTATAMGAGGTVLINYSYQWDATAANQTTATATGLLAGWYGVTVSDDNGCQAVDSVWITSSSAISLIDTVLSDYNGEDISCVGASDGIIAVLPSGGNGVYSYSWQNQLGSTAYPYSNTLAGLGAGIYTVTVTDSSGCAAITSIGLNDPIGLTIILDTLIDATCAGGSTGEIATTATGGTANYTYLWNDANAQATAIATALAAGNYTVVVTDANNCTAQTSARVKEPTAAITTTTTIASNYNGAQISCVNARDGIAAATATGGTASYSYTWNISTGVQTGVIATGLGAGNHELVVTDALGCTDTTMVTLVAPNAVNLNIISTVDPSCFGQMNGTAAVAGNGGTGTLSYSWSNGQNTPTLTAVGAGLYTLTLTDANNCKDTISVLLNEGLPIATPQIIPDFSVCLGHSIQLSILAANPNYTYTWSGPNGFSATVPNPLVTTTATVLNTGNYTIYANDSLGCQSMDTMVVVTVNSTQAILAQNNSPACLGTDVRLTTLAVTGATSYKWYKTSTGAYIGAGQNFVLSNLTNVDAGDYYVLVDIGTCQITSSPTTVTIETVSVSANAGVDQEKCGANDIILEANVLPIGATGQWTSSANANIANANSPITTVANLGIGTHTFVWTVNGACAAQDADSIVVMVHKKPIAAADYITVSYNNADTSINVIANDDLGEDWTIAITSPMTSGQVYDLGEGLLEVNLSGVTADQQFIYEVCNPNCPQITCDTALVILNIEGAENCIVPNIITPNGDGNNDRFEVPCLIGYEGGELVVVNRWGDEIYSDNNYQNDWDGTHLGKILPDGTYFYILKLKDGSHKQGYLEIRK